MTAPLVSVIIPVYNRRRMLREALASVFAQTMRDFEVIVVDDGSTDDTPMLREEIADARLVWLVQTNGGCGKARNTGLRAARGEFVALLDSDDLWPEDKLEWQVARMREADAPDLLFGAQEYFHDPPRPNATPVRLPAPLASSVIVRRSVFDRTGLFDESLAGADFVKWCALCRDMGMRDETPDRVAFFRRSHDGNETNDIHRVFAGHARVLKERLDRMRAAKSA